MFFAFFGERISLVNMMALDDFVLIPFTFSMSCEEYGAFFLEMNVSGFVVPNGDSMAPPNLSTDAPVAEVVDPLKIGFVEAFWDDFYVFVSDGFLGEFFEGGFLSGGFIGEFFFYGDEPLLGDHGFDDAVASVAKRDSVFVIWVLCYKEVFLLHHLGRLFSSGFDRESFTGAGEVGHLAVEVNFLKKKFFEVESGSEFVVVFGVGGGDGHGAGPLLHVDDVVGDDPKFSFPCVGFVFEFLSDKLASDNFFKRFVFCF